MPLLLALMLTIACSGGKEENKTPPPPEKAAEKAPEFKIDPATMAAEAQNVVLVPSPAEMERALSNAGLGSKLAQMVKGRDIKMDVEDKDQIAVRLGVVLADTVLTAKDSPKEQLAARLDRLKEGFNKLGAGQDVQATIDDLKNRIANDAVSREDLIKEMDELSGVMVPELQFEAGDWVVPLIQAGSWLEGANLVSGALLSEKKYDAATGLLKQPAVVDYFLKYVQRDGRTKAPDEVVKRLEATLQTLKEVAAKDTLGEAEVNTVHSSTTAVLEML
jgi:hypothetical protein